MVATLKLMHTHTAKPLTGQLTEFAFLVDYLLQLKCSMGLG